MSNQGNRLPPLPGSDDDSLRRNYYDHFYKKRPSDIWTGNTDRFEDREPEKCDHYFEETSEGVQCKKCHFGLTGEGLEIRDGKLFYRNKQIL